MSDDVKSSVQQQFGGVAQQYATSTVFSQGVDLELIGRIADEARPTRALDVGTAAGHVAFAIAPHAGLVVGLDLTHAMLLRAGEEAAARGLRNLGVCQGDVENLPLPSASFDLVTCRFSGHHFPNPDRFAAEAARILRPGGQIVLGDTVSPADQSQDRWINQIEVLRDPSHVRDYTIAEWQRLFDDVGLTTESLLEWQLDLDFDDWIRRQRTPLERVEQIRTLFREAQKPHRESFRLRMPEGAPWHFALHCAVLRARNPA